jgi:hypothetical protein
MPIIWKFPDHHIEITHLTDNWLQANRRMDETTDQAVMRLAVEIAAKTPHLRQGVPQLIKTADLPANRANRADWTLDNGTKRIRNMTAQEKTERDNARSSPR